MYYITLPIVERVQQILTRKRFLLFNEQVNGNIPLHMKSMYESQLFYAKI